MRRAFVLLLIPISGACGAVQQLTFTPPDVTVTQVAVTGLGLSGGTLDVAVRIQNPNSYDLRTTRGALSLALEEIPFGTLEILQALRVPARGDTVVRLPVTFTWSGVGAGARALLDRGSVAYRLTGQLEADTPIGVRVVEVSGGGSVTLADVMR